MSQREIKHALDRIHLREIAIAPNSVSGFQTDLVETASITFQAGELQMLEQRGQLAAAYGGSSETPERKPFAFANGMAVIPVHGSLINRFASSYGSITGYNFIRQQFDAAQRDPDVKGIIFDVHSNGGEVAGCFETADAIYTARGNKPTMAIVDSNGYSAAFAIATAADTLVLTPSAGVGSVGVISMHVDASVALDNLGVKITLITAGEHKADGNPFQALPEAVRKDVQANIDEMRSTFVNNVAKYRGIDAKGVNDTEARTYRGQKAVDIGFADAVMTVPQALESFSIALSGANQQGLPTMTTATTAPAANGQAAPAAAAPTAQEIRAAEQARCAAIMSSPEATGREKMAQHLAFNTSMSADEANALLKMSPTAAAPAPAAAVPEANPLAAAMAAAGAGGPAVTADAAAGGGGEPSLFEQAMSAYGTATGRSFTQTKQ